MFITDRRHNIVRKIEASTGNIVRIAGTGESGFTGDGGQATSAKLNAPFASAVDSHGNVFIADTGNNRIRRIDATTKVITTIAGDGTAPNDDPSEVPAALTSIKPYGIAIDTADDLYFSDNHFFLKKLDIACMTIAAVMENPLGENAGIAVDRFGNVFVSYPNSHQVWRRRHHRPRGAHGRIDPRLQR